MACPHREQIGKGLYFCLQQGACCTRCRAVPVEIRLNVKKGASNKTTSALKKALVHAARHFMEGK